MSFDPNAFLQTEIAEAVSTQYVTVPEGEYLASVKKLEGRSPKEDMAVLEVFWEIDDEAVREETGMDSPTVRQSIFLDVTDTGMLALGKGKNVQLGRLRAALNQNQDGKAWSPNQMVGNVARITVTHRIVTHDADGNEHAEPRVFAEVAGVVPA